MNKYSYNMTLAAVSQDEADNKVQALATLGRKLSAKELTRLAEVVQNDPVKTKIAKKALGL